MLKRLFALSQSRRPWLILACIGLALVWIAHAVFQKWLWMAPCEQCVYVRFGFIVFALGALFVALNPKSLPITTLGSSLSLSGVGYAFGAALTLTRVHAAIHSDGDALLFGLQGCSSEAHYPFDLPLARLWPDWFAPTGECGMDAPVVAAGAKLSALQQWAINLYTASEGWYLIPAWKFMNMAQCCVVLSVILGLAVFALFFGSWQGHRGRY